MKPLIHIEHVSKTYESGSFQVHALREIHLSIQEGEFLALVGPSGSGKTTLLNIMGSLDIPTSGQVFLDGEDLFRHNEATLADLRLQKLGFIFQSYNLIPVLSAYENVEFPLLLRRIPAETRKNQVEQILQELGLAEQIHKRPSEMSGGQQQRVAVARAIVTKPRLVLADEPTANLDSKTSQELLERMRQLNEKYKTTFVFSTHDPLVMQIARRIVYLRDGQIEREESR